MPRREFHPPHLYEADTSYFLTASTAQHQWLFDTDPKRTLLCDILRESAEQLGITLHGWVILADHYHLLLDVGSVAPIHRFVKLLHGHSAVLLNKLDATPGRQVWYQYWDRFPRNEDEFWSYLNYIHINPLKHGYVAVACSTVPTADPRVTVTAEAAPDVHQAVAGYPYSSYHCYVQKYGEEFLTDAWLRYPLPGYVEFDGP